MFLSVKICGGYKRIAIFFLLDWKGILKIIDDITYIKTTN